MDPKLAPRPACARFPEGSSARRIRSPGSARTALARQFDRLQGAFPGALASRLRRCACAFLLATGIPVAPAGEPPPLEILGHSVGPGERARLTLDYGAAFLGDSHGTPVLVVHGAKPGPSLCLTAAVHGDEINGVEVIRRVLREVSPETLHGTVIAVPAVNWLAFLQRSRETPDRRDINRYFPGAPAKDYGSHLTHQVFERVLHPHCKYLVDLHSATLEHVNLPQLRVDPDDPGALRLSTLMPELPVLWEDGSPRMLRRAAAARGVIAVVLEFGAGNTVQQAPVAAVTHSLLAMMQRLGMREGQPPPTAPQEIYPDSLWLRVAEGGLFLGARQVGDRVETGQPIGAVVQLLGERELTLHSPVTGRILGLSQDQFVLPGYGVAHIGILHGADKP